MNGFYLYRNAWRYDGAPDQEPVLNKAEWKALLKKDGLLVRNTFDFDCAEQTSFWYVIKDRFEGLDELSSNERNKVRKALKTLDFQLIDPIQLEREGWPILKATYEDYAISDRKMNQQVFLRYLEECKLRNYDYWGIFYEGHLVGFCTVWLWKPDSCEYGLIGVLPEYKHNNTYPYYGLFYQMTAYYLNEKKFRYVTDGSRSVTEHSNIQNFLIDNFLFRKAYCRLKVHYKWWVGLAVKLLYPFRKIVTMPQVKAVLNMEAMQHGKE